MSHFGTQFWRTSHVFDAIMRASRLKLKLLGLEIDAHNRAMNNVSSVHNIQLSDSNRRSSTDDLIGIEHTPTD